MDKVALLANLRSLFREELEDQLVILDRETAALRASDPARAAEAVRELYRAIHSLKGASSAANAPNVERLCHEAESKIAPRDTPMDPAALEAVVVELARQLRALAPTLFESSAAPVSVPPPPSPPESEPEPASLRTPESPPAQPPRRDIAEPRAETVRVPVARLGELAVASDELVALAAGAAAGAMVDGEIDELLGEIRADLSRGRLLLRDADTNSTSSQLLNVFERSLVLVQNARLENMRRRELADKARRHLTATASDLGGRLRALRMVSVGELEEVLRSGVREAAREAGVSVDFSIRGRDVEVDRRIRDNLREPLLHLVRNAVAHAIESPAERARRGKPSDGSIVVDVSVAARELRIVVSDDGRGIDGETLRSAAARMGIDVEGRDERELQALVFAPGFTTRTEATSLAGRGLGLDVVRNRIAAMHGRIDVSSTPGVGTRFTLTLPLDLGSVRGLVVNVRDARMIIVVSAVERVRFVAEEDTRSIEGRLFVMDQGVLIPLVDLAEVLDLVRRSSPRASRDRYPCVIVAAGDRRAALSVDAITDERDLLVRALRGRFRRTAFVAGATILEDGDVALVLDIAETIALARPAQAKAVTELGTTRRRRILVADDSITTRQLIRSILEAGGFAVVVAKDGAEAWQLLSSDESFDAVVSDVEMPGLDGFQLLSRVRRTGSTNRLPFVLVTALDTEVDRQRAVELGASAYFVKSGFDEQSLIQTVESLL